MQNFSKIINGKKEKGRRLERRRIQGLMSFKFNKDKLKKQVQMLLIRKFPIKQMQFILIRAKLVEFAAFLEN